MRRIAAATFTLAVCLSSILPAQTDTVGSAAEPEDLADVLILDHDFIAGGSEFVRVFLQGKRVYRAELSTPDLTLLIRSPLPRVELPRVYSLIGPDTPSGMSVVEIYPDVDGEFEIRSSWAGKDAVGTRLRLYRDGRESRRRAAIVKRPGWEIGIELAAGWHTASGTPGQSSLVAADREAGTDVEGCFVARNAPGMPVLSWCAIGLGVESRSPAKSVFWVFTEPRVNLIGAARPGRSNWELGLLFRVGMGSTDGMAQDPILLAPGLYFARHIRSGLDGSGWSFLASYSHATMLNLEQASGASRPGNDRLRLGIGWYQ